MKRFAAGGIIFICTNKKVLSLINYMEIGAEADGRVTNLSQKIKGEKNAEGEALYGISKPEAIASKHKRK